MRILFVHQNFPGQFVHLAPALASKGHEVVATTLQSVTHTSWNGIKLVPYSVSRGTSSNIHPWVSDTETKVIRAEGCYKAALDLRNQGFYPDVIVAHHGWGESLFLKDVWPESKLAIYCEFFYRQTGFDSGFDPEFPPQVADACRLHLKNVNNLLHFQIADAGISPTLWQASSFPKSFRSRITVVHDGIDAKFLSPDKQPGLTINKTIHLTKNDKILTFVNRNLEPYRGWHIFARSLPAILEANPGLRVLIVGGFDVSYGAKPPQGSTWKDIFFNEVKDRLDHSRVHFLGRLPYQQYLAVMQLSTVHVYLTYPFVLSWSLLEAMSLQCAIVASDTPPVAEVLQHDYSAKLVNFFDYEAISARVTELLNDSAERKMIGENARRTILKHYDLRSVCLPKQIEWVESRFTI